MADRSARRAARLPAVLAAAIGVVAILGVLGWLALPIIAERVIVHRLTEMGIPEPRLSVLSVGPGRAVAVALGAGSEGEFSAREIVVTYDLPDLLQGRIDAIVLREPSLRIRVGPDGVSLGSLDPLLAGGGSGGMTLPPIRIEDATLRLATPAGPVALALDGTISGETAALDASLDVSASSDRFTARGTLTLHREGDAIRAALEIAESRAALPGVIAAAATGRIVVQAEGGAIADAEAALALTDVAIADSRLAALGPLSGEARLAGDAEGWTLTATFEDQEASTSLSMRAHTAEPRLDAPVMVAADLALDSRSPLWRLTRLPAPSNGDAAVHAVGEIVPAALLDAAAGRPVPPLDASLTVQIEALEIPSLVERLSLAGGIDLRGTMDEVVATAAAPLLATLQLTDAQRSALPAAVQGLAAGPLELTLALPAPLRLVRQADGATADGAVALTLDLADGHRLLDADANGTVMLADGAVSADLPALQAAVDLPPLDGLPAVHATLAGNAVLAGGSAGAELDVALGADRLDAAGIELRQAALDLPLRLSVAEGRIDVALRADGLLSAAQARGNTPVTLSTPLRLELPAEGSTASLDMSDPADPAARGTLISGPLRLAGNVRSEGGETIAGTLAFPQLRLAADGSTATGWSIELGASDGSFTVPDYGIEATGLDLAAEKPAGAPARLRLEAGIAHRGEPAWLVPLAASLDAHRTETGWAFSASAGDAFERLAVSVEGAHDLGRGRGRATVEMAPIDFIPGVRQPKDIAPVLAGDAEEVSGTLALAGDVSWTADTIGSNLELLLRDLSFTTDMGVIDKINGVIAVDGLSPFSTPPGQQVAVALINAGLPLTDGLLTFRVAPGPVLEIAEGRLHLAGGSVALKDFAYDPAAARNASTLTVEDVELGELLALAGVAGLTGQGRLSGHLPFALTADDLVISGGELEAEAPGWLSYAPLTPPAALQGQGETVSLALSALTNFQYQALRLTIDREAGGEMVVGMHVRGSNPDFYDGYPVEFNLNVSGELDRVLRQGLAGYRIPETIEERLEEFAQ